MNYYEEVYNAIKQLISDKAFDQARIKLEEELSLPYIPNAFEPLFKEQLKEVYNELRINDNTTIMIDEAKIKALLNDELVENQLLGVAYLNNLKLTPYLGDIYAYLRAPQFEEVQCLLIYELIEAQIKDEVKTYKDGMKVTFIPNYCELPQDSDGFIMSMEYLAEHINQEPSVFELCKQVLHFEVVRKLPFCFEADEVEILSQSIIKYVYESLNLVDNWIAYCDKYTVDERKMINFVA